MKLDAFDVMTAAGVLCIAGGVAMWSVPLALVVIGVALVGLGLAGAWRKGQERQE